MDEGPLPFRVEPRLLPACELSETCDLSSCFSTDTYWFSGPRCEVAVQWRALVGGLAGAGALLLLLLLGALSFWVMRSWKKDSG